MAEVYIDKSIYDKIQKKQIKQTPLKIFFSHADEDKKLASEIKSELKQFKIDTFLAHDDMTPMNPPWDIQILENIKNCDVFIPLFTKNFIKSEWTCQETGIAIGRKKSIISLKIDTKPTGFLDRNQALKLKVDDIHKSCLEIIKTIIINTNEDPINDILKDCIINSLRNASNFDKSEERLTILKDLKLNNNQVNEIFNSAITNNQIRMSQLGISQLKKWRIRYSDNLDPDTKNTYDEIKNVWNYFIYE